MGDNVEHEKEFQMAVGESLGGAQRPVASPRLFGHDDERLARGQEAVTKAGRRRPCRNPLRAAGPSPRPSGFGERRTRGDWEVAERNETLF